jgi:anti-anti-sigma factor
MPVQPQFALRVTVPGAGGGEYRGRGSGYYPGMDDQTYSLTAEPGDADGSVVLKIRGDLDITARDDLTATIAGLAGSGCEQLVVDLSEVTFIDSEALSGLLEGYAAARDQGARLTATGARGIVHRVLQLTGLLSVLQHP